MEILRESSEDEMILEFLKAESTSERFSEKLLGDFRGYGENRELFERFPQVTEWTLCSFSEADLERIRYIDYKSFVIVEGHQRMTAYALVPECFHNVEAVVGKCSEEELGKWM